MEKKDPEYDSYEEIYVILERDNMTIARLLIY